MDNTFRARVQKIFGSLSSSSSSSSLSPPWSLTDGEGSAMKGGRSKTETKRTDSKLSVKRGAPSKKVGKKLAAKKGKAAKDPNKSNRPASAFFVFMEEFRKTYKEKHPNNKSVAAVGKAGGDKWKSLSEAMTPYVAKAKKRKTEYNKTLEAYNKKMAEGPADEEESDKLRSEVNDEDDEDDESGEVYALPWLVIVAAMIILKIVSMGRKKFSEAISGGKLVIDVAYFGFHIYSKTDELCGKISCPISAGGTYTLTMKMEDGNKNQLTCINFDFSIGFFVSDTVVAL
ncbi:unnamed protein product [Camellia sinensis]